MFASFTKYLTPGRQPETRLPEDWLERLDAISRQLLELQIRNDELRRIVARTETKITKMGIALGVAEAVTRSQ